MLNWAPKGPVKAQIITTIYLLTDPTKYRKKFATYTPQSFVSSRLKPVNNKNEYQYHSPQKRRSPAGEEKRRRRTCAGKRAPFSAGGGHSRRMLRRRWGEARPRRLWAPSPLSLRRLRRQLWGSRGRKGDGFDEEKVATGPTGRWHPWLWAQPGHCQTALFGLINPFFHPVHTNLCPLLRLIMVNKNIFSPSHFFFLLNKINFS